MPYSKHYSCKQLNIWSFIWGIVYFCTSNGSFRIMRENSNLRSKLICTVNVTVCYPTLAKGNKYFCQLEIDHETQQPKDTCQRTCRGPSSPYKTNSSIQPSIYSSNLVYSLVSCCTASFQIHWDSQHNTYFQSSITILLYSTKLSSTFSLQIFST